MKKELDEALCRDFPKLFKDRSAPMNRTAMCWGFDCGDGWEPLIRECAAKLEAINDKIENPDHHIVASQVKEKFGTLRFYTGSYPSEFDAEYSEAINTAEDKSGETCEVCGKPGKTVGGGWLKTVCDDHKRKDDGQTTVEWMLIFMVVVVVLSVLGGAVEKRFPGTLESVKEAIDTLGEVALEGVTSGRDTP